MADRTDANGAAFAGSQLQTQLYVNRRQDQLNAAIFDAFPEVADADIEWRSPLVGNGYAEYSDKAFLDRVDLGAHAAGLKAFWPKGGPHWDALAVIRRPGQLHPGVLLAEGKSYPGGAVWRRVQGQAWVDVARTYREVPGRGATEAEGGGPNRGRLVRTLVPVRQPPRPSCMAAVARGPCVASSSALCG